MRLLGLDIGSKTIGVAVSDEGEVVALPLRTLPRRGGEADVSAVRGVMQETGAQALVVGLPLDLDGSEGEAAHRSRALGERLAAALGCPVYYSDERFSTAEAERILLGADLSRRRRRQVINHGAAARILQGFLDRGEGRDGGPESEPPTEAEGGP